MPRHHSDRERKRMLRTVLLPTDFSKDDRLVWAFAKGLPGLGVRRIVLAHVIDASGLEGPVIGTKADEARDRLAEVAARLEEAGLLVELRVPAGDPFRSLLALAAEHRIDAVVCGTHGKHLLERVIAGSISERLLHECHNRILLTRYDLLSESADPASLAGAFGRQVVMPTDFSDPARHAFDAALELPAGALESLHLVHVIEDILDPGRRETVLSGARFQLENMQEIAERRGITTTYAVPCGDPKGAVLAEIASCGATGVIVGSRGRSPLGEMFLGSVSTHMVREAPCPVMVVP